MSSDIRSTDPDVIRADIERTRAGLSQDVNALGEAVSPGAMARHQVNKATAAVTSLKEHVMGSADEATSSLGDGAAAVGDRASQATRAAKRKTQGNPLAAGVIALGAGWLLGSLVPTTDRERQAAATVKEKAQPIVEEAQSVAQESAQHLKEPAKDSVTAVKEAAQSAVQTMQAEGQSAAKDVKGSAAGAAQSVQDQAGGQGQPERW